MPPPTAWTHLALLVLLVALVYANTLNVPFVFDDEGAVLLNPTIRELGSWEVLRPAADGSTTTARPLVNLSLAFNYAISGEAPWSYHLVNLAIHAGCTLLLFGLVRRTAESVGALRPATFGFVTAALWAVHPLQTETVVTIAQRTESLCALFYLLTLYAFARAVWSRAVLQPAIDQPTAPEGGLKPRLTASSAWLLISLLACLAGMASKEVMVTAPVVVLLFDRTFVAGSFGAAWRARRTYYLSLAATWLLLGSLVLGAGAARGDAAGIGQGVSSWHYLLTQAGALVHYVRLSLWPHPLLLDYGTAVTRDLTDAFVPGVVVLGALVATGWAFVRRPVAGFLAGSFFLLLAPSSSFIPLVTQTIAEHRMYLPLATLAVAAAWAAGRLPRGAAILGGLVVALGVATAARNADYRDPVRLWQDNAIHAPGVPRVFNNFAVALQRAGRTEEAATAYRRALQLDPDYVSAYLNWGMALLEQDQPAAAVERLARAVELAPQHVDARFSLATALVRAGRGGEAVPHFEHLVQRQPSAEVYHNLALALAAEGRSDDAVRALETAIRLAPAQRESRWELVRLLDRAGRAAAARGDLAAAERHFRAWVELAPEDPGAQANLGNVFLLLGQPAAAIRSYERALQLRPGDPRLRESLELAREAMRGGR